MLGLKSASLIVALWLFAPQQVPQQTPQATPVSASVAMVRSDPKLSQVRLEISLYGSRAANPSYQGPQSATVYPPFRLPSGAQIAIPVITRTSWCDTDFTVLDARFALDGRETRLEAGRAFTRASTGVEALVLLPIPATQSAYNEIRSTVVFMTQRWELTVDESMAARATWPRSWPSSVDRFLAKETGIDPSDAAIKTCAEQATAGGPRSVSPFIAARNAIVGVVKRWKSLSGGTSEFGPDQSLRGIRFSSDGVYGIGVGRGSNVELAVTCVSALRSIGLPSRVVYCLYEDGENVRGKSRTKFRFICEFYLPDVGWVPFDPAEMRLQGVTTRAIQGPVKGFANVSDLEDTLPIAFRPVPEGYEQADRIAAWGWKAPGASIDSSFAISRMYLDESGRGNGKVKSMPAPVGDDAP